MSEKLFPPYRYGLVNPGIHRGSYPVLPNYRFLSRLQLKTVISLIPEPPTEDLKTFGDMAGCTILHFTVLRTAMLSESLQSTLLQAIQICIDTKYHPVYIHCLDGRRITSLLILLLRKIQGWTPLYCFSEYWRFQVAFKPLFPASEVERTTKELEKWCCNDVLEVVVPEGATLPAWLWGDDKKVSLVGVKIRNKRPTPVNTSNLPDPATVLVGNNSNSATGTATPSGTTSNTFI